MVESDVKIRMENVAPRYVLDSTDSEHERLIRQTVHLASCTERFLSEAGISTGQRILDPGSGVGGWAQKPTAPIARCRASD